MTTQVAQQLEIYVKLVEITTTQQFVFSRPPMEFYLRLHSPTKSIVLFDQVVNRVANTLFKTLTETDTKAFI